MSRASYTVHERRQTYHSIRRILEKFENNDLTLGHLSQLAMADGFPAGGNGGGRSKGDHSDPTGAAVDARTDGTDDASRAFTKLQEALLVFGEAEVLMRRALPPNPADYDATPEPKKNRPSTADVWCSSCARVRRGKEILIFEPRTSRSGGRRDLCDWCQQEWLGSSEAGKRKLPDVRLVMARHYARSMGAHLTERRRTEALAMAEAECRKRYLPVPIASAS